MFIATNITIDSQNSQRFSRFANIDRTNFDSLAIKFVENIEYFDLIYKNSNNTSIVNIDRYIFYRDIVVFVNRLKNIAKEFVEKYRVKKFVLDYLRDNSLI